MYLPLESSHERAPRSRARQAIAFVGSIMVSVSIYRALVNIDALPIAIPGGFLPGYWPGQAAVPQQQPPFSPSTPQPPTYS